MMKRSFKNIAGFSGGGYRGKNESNTYIYIFFNADLVPRLRED